MAQTNYTPIQLYYSTTAAAVPVNTNLLNGELAINITDGKLYYKDNSGTVQVIATKGAGTIGGLTTQIQYNNAGALAGSSAMVFNNSTNVVTLTTLNLTNALGAIYGGTGQSTYTTGDLLYSSASNTLSKLAIGTANYILTVNSAGTNVQWSAPSAISVSTATNLAGGVAGSVPYQSGASTTTFLGIGAADRVMTSSGSAPQWVTALTGLTGVSSSSITNTSLTSGRVVYSSTGGLQTNSANLTFDGTTLTTAGLSNSGTSALVKLVTVGGTSFSGTTVFAPATPAKLYMGTGTVTDTTSAIGATNAVGAVASLGVTPIAATNTSVTYTDAATLYIAGAPSAGTNVTLTNPYALYIAAGNVYLGGGTANGVAYLNGSKVLTTGSALVFNGTNFGVGTTNSTYPLAVKTSTAGSGIAVVADAAQPNYAGISFLQSDGATQWGNISVEQTDLRFYTGTTEGMRLTSTSLYTASTINVGIGTSSPGNKLTVKPSATSSGTLDVLTGSTNTDSVRISGGGTVNTWLEMRGYLGVKLYSDATNTVTVDSSGNLGLGVTPSANAGVSTLNIANYNRTLSALTLGSNGNSAGYVGYNMGNTSTANLYRYIASDTGSAIYFAGNEMRFMQFASGSAGATTNGTQAMTLDANGNLGIGTTSPAKKLDVYLGTTGTVGQYLRNTTINLLSQIDGTTSAQFGTETSHPLVFLTANTERARIDSSGNVGIGTSSPAGKLTVDPGNTSGTQIDGLRLPKNFTAQANFVAWQQGANGWRVGIPYGDNTYPLAFYYGASTPTASSPGTQLMTLDASGNLLVGGTSNVAGARLISENASGNQLGLRYTSVATWYNSVDSSGNYIWTKDGTNIARINSSGNLLVGTTTPTSAERLSIWRDNVTTNSLVANIQNQAATSTSRNSNTLLRISSNASGADAAIQLTDNTANNYWFGGNNGGAYVVANSNGVRLANGGTSWASDSDERIKDIIEPILDAANKVLTLRAVIGKYKTDKDGTRRSFLIAQDVQAVLPEAVFDEQGTLMLAYTDTIPLLVAAIQEQQALITQLTARITALESA